MRLEAMRRELDRRINARNATVQNMAQEQKECEALEVKVAHITEAQVHLQQLAQAVQQKAHEQIAKIVSKCLTTVFGDMYQLNIEFVKLRGKTEAKLVYIKEGHEVDPLLTSGGVLDVSALALRIANLILSDPSPRKLLVLDEPFRGVSDANLPKVCAVIETLATELAMQFLIITHNERLQIGTVYQLG